MAYDAIGNMTTVCGNFEDTTTYKIDNVYMSFVTKETTPPNQFGKKLTKQFVTEPNFGKQLQLTDPNGNVFTTAIDGFGRSVASYGPNPTNKNQLVLLDTIVFGSNATGNFVQTFSRQDWDNTGPYSAWNMDRNSSDKFGRSVKNESTGWSTIVSERVFSDLFMDLIEKESFPYFEGQALIIPQWVIFTYALNGQMTAKTSNGLTTYYGNNKFDREKYEVVEGDTATNYYNDIGLLIKRKDPNGGITTFDHDGRGNIKSITDPNGVVNTTTFNNLGQAKTITNPDQGTTNFRLQKGRVVNQLVLYI
jgi:YD repeat-containing protein